MSVLPTFTRLVQLAVLVVGGYIAIRILSAAFAGAELSFDREDLMPFGAMMIGVAIVGLIRSGKRLYDDR